MLKRTVVAMAALAAGVLASELPVKMQRTNPSLELLVDGVRTRLILSADVDGILVCSNADTSRRDWTMSDAEFDNARRRLRYELHYVTPEMIERDVEVPALGFIGRLPLGFFKLGNQPLRLAAIEYFLGSSGADGFIGAGFAFHSDHASLWKIIQQTASDGTRYTYHGASSTEDEAGTVELDGDTPFGQMDVDGDYVASTDTNQYVWSEPQILMVDGDGQFTAEGISFPVHDVFFRCKRPESDDSAAPDDDRNDPQRVQLFGEHSSNWHVVVDFNYPCLVLPTEFYDVLAGWLGLAHDAHRGLSGIAMAAAELPDLVFSLSHGGIQLMLPLRALVLPELTNAASASVLCIQRSESIVQEGTSTLSSHTETGIMARSSSRRQGAHSGLGLAVLNMLDVPVVFGTMVLDALDSVEFDGVTKRTSIRVTTASTTTEPTRGQATACLAPASCIGDQHFVVATNVCQDPDCSRYYFHHLESATKTCAIDPHWLRVLAVTTTLFVAAELFFSFSFRRLVLRSQQTAESSTPRARQRPRRRSM